MNRRFTRIALAAVAVFGLGSAASAQTVLKIGYTVPKESHYGAGATAFCDEVERGTQGRYKCQQFPSGALGGEREMVEAVQLGTQDVVLTSTGPVGNFVPEIKVLDIPFLFRDYEHARKVLDGKIGQELLTKFPSKGMVALAWSENGFRHMTNNKRAIQSASDASGLKLRTMENKVHMAAYKTFGILPTPMSMTEVFTALQQGTVDGQENPIPVILSAKFSQVQKHLSLTGHVYSPALLLMSQSAWGKLSDADKQVFQAAAKKSAEVQRKRVNDDEASGLAQLKKDGMQVIEKVDGDSFRKAVGPAYAEFAKEFGADRIAAIQAVR
ncbi:TRAP transporter substrate-binding protein [Caldimonas tepidiphila]|uniref:TRAP transporter substrate-binding protein n=1 Tax=Caldimonas tepidiphila TaxID=2315841 RepID=UPI000E5A18DC|nr:TRAP transporter substrate-binding protein [Caldimonas tepidiphila]